MPRYEMFTDPQRRHIVHIYAALREHIVDEIEYDRAPDFAPMDDTTKWAISEMITNELTRLMCEAHAGEAERLQVEGDAWWAEHVAPYEPAEVVRKASL